MSLFSTLLRASLLLVLVAGAPVAGRAAPVAGPAPCTPIVAKPAPAAATGQEPTGQPVGAVPQQLTLQFGRFQLHYRAHLDCPTLLDRLLFHSRVAALARQVARGNGPRLPF